MDTRDRHNKMEADNTESYVLFVLYMDIYALTCAPQPRVRQPPATTPVLAPKGGTSNHLESGSESTWSPGRQCPSCAIAIWQTPL